MRDCTCVLKMSDDQLMAVLAIVVPGRKAQKMGVERGEMQEICIKWLFVNGLSINHIFEFETDQTGQLYCVMRNSEACNCCPKVSQNVTISEFDRGPIGENFRRSPSPVPRNTGSPNGTPKGNGCKITPITLQPTVIKLETDEDRKLKDGEDREKSSCGYCKRECGLCIVNLCSQI